jgi:hypothetical protein
MSDRPDRLKTPIASLLTAGAVLVAGFDPAGIVYADPGRHTRMVGKIAVTANDFVARPDGVTGPAATCVWVAGCN